MARGFSRARHRRVAEKDQKRAARACDLCRQEKEKCEGGIPCTRCVRLHRECKLSISLKTRGSSNSIPAATNQSTSHQSPVHTSTQQSTAEATSAISNVPDISELVERQFHLEEIVRRKLGVQNLDLQALRALALESQQQDASIGSGESMNYGLGSPAVDEKCSIQPIEHNVALQTSRANIHIGIFPWNWNFSMQIKKRTRQNIPQNARAPVEGLTEFWCSKDLQCLSSTLAAVYALPPRPIADFLKLDTVYQSSPSLSQNDAGTICTLFGVLAIGRHYAHLEANHGDVTDSTTQHPPNVTPFSGQTASLAFYHQACRLLPDVITIASLESAQACLILGVFALPLDASGLAWTYLGLAVKLAVLNGMHQKFSQNYFDLQTRELRIKLWNTICSLERRIGIFHGRPVSIDSAGLGTDEVANRHLNGDATTPFSCSEATLRLNGMLNWLAGEMSSLKWLSSTESLYWGYERLSRSQSELVAWWDSLPKKLSRLKLSAPPRDIRCLAHLRLEYFLVRMFIGRIFLFPEQSSGNFMMGPIAYRDHRSAVSVADINRLESQFIADCVDAALEAIETCRFLKSTMGLARASYSEFSSCRAALLIIVIQCFQTGSREYRNSLREGLSLPKEMASWAELARVEAALIDAFERVLVNMDFIQSENSADESGYMQFQQWENMWKENKSATNFSNMVRQDGMAQMANPSWQGYPNIRESALYDMASFPMLGHREHMEPIYQPQAYEDLSALLGFNVQPP